VPQGLLCRDAPDRRGLEWLEAAQWNADRANVGLGVASVEAWKTTMAVGRVIGAVLMVCACATCAQAQNATPPPSPASEPALARRPVETPAAAQTIALTLPKGTALQVTLDREVRVAKVGQPVHGRVVEPVFAFDKLVIPADTEVTGQITKIERVSGGTRTVAALDADLTPTRKVDVEFNQIKLPDGKQMPVETIVTPGSGQVIEFVTAPDGNHKKDPVAAKVKGAKHQVKQEWDNALKKVQEHGKVHRLKHFVVGELPIHPQYINAGTVYFAELQEPLDFGSEPLSPELTFSLGKMPPDGSVVQARLATPLTSATAHQGDPVEAVVSQPLWDGNRLILPQGSRLEGTVVQVHAARHPARNGVLRIVFRDLRLPDGVEQKVAASLEGVESAKRDNVKLDSEGGAAAAAPKTKLLSASATVALGAASFLGDSFGETGPRTAGGAGGFKLIGIGLGLAVHSQPFGMVMGCLGGARAIYGNFIAPGHDVVFPKNTAMAIAVQSRLPSEQIANTRAADGTTKR
jgi:hypothetical protein